MSRRAIAGKRRSRPPNRLACQSGSTCGAASAGVSGAVSQTDRSMRRTASAASGGRQSPACNSVAAGCEVLRAAGCRGGISCRTAGASREAARDEAAGSTRCVTSAAACCAAAGPCTATSAWRASQWLRWSARPHRRTQWTSKRCQASSAITIGWLVRLGAAEGGSGSIADQGSGASAMGSARSTCGGVGGISRTGVGGGAEAEGRWQSSRCVSTASSRSRRSRRVSSAAIPAVPAEASPSPQA